MKWNKQGLIYAPDKSLPWAQKYAFPPLPLLIKPDVLRIYFASCDEKMVGRAAYVDISAEDFSSVLRVSKNPIFDIGEPGAFDENGVVPTTVLKVRDEIWMYYVGYQLGQKVRYYQYQGLAISTDDGETFHRKRKVPVLDRSDAEMLNRCSAHVQFDGEKFRMWYSAGSDWTRSNGKDFPVYNIKYLESADGVNWGKQGATAIDFVGDEHALGKPFVIFADGKYRMFFSMRVRDVKGYRLGYAESNDCLNWTRKNDQMQMDVSADGGWDSESISYTSLIQHRGNWYMFYNGNNLGETGFGYAVLESW